MFLMILKLKKMGSIEKPGKEKAILKEKNKDENFHIFKSKPM